MMEQIREKYKELFLLCDEINEYAKNIASQIKPDKESLQEQILLYLFVRMQEGARATITLVKEGFDNDAAATLRNVFESLVLLKLCCDDNNFVKEYFLYPEAQNLEFLEKALREPSDEFNKYLLEGGIERGLNVDEYVAEKKDMFSKLKINHMEILKKLRNKRRLAENAGLTELYKTLYSVTSDSTHISAKTIIRYLKTDKNGEIIGLDAGPHDIHARLHLSTVLSLLLFAIKTINRFFGLNEDKAINHYEKRLLEK
jgi:hypothetical protein